MSELLWLLLPVAAASGWFAAQRSFQKAAHSVSKLSSDYLKGLNYLLNEQPDKAIDVLIELISVDTETVETHLALGALFRRRGEVQRAIRIHQSLLEHPSVTSAQRSLALLELGQDYRRAGLLDRAEDVFTELLSVEQYREYAYQQLLDVYQQEHDWDKAIATAQDLAKVSGQSLNPVIAHYYCQQADTFREQGQREAALHTLQQALSIDARCVRASLLEGQLALSTGDTCLAIQAFKRVEQQDTDYLSEIIEPLQTCYRNLGQQAEFIAYLHHILENYGGIVPLVVLTKLIKQEQGEPAAAAFLSQHLLKRSSLKGLDYLLELALAEAQSLTPQHLQLLKTMTSRLLKDKAVYQCRECGFMGKSLHWQCPSCKQWNTLKPIQGIDGE
ncbi:MAG: lipopolysaccharide assembly protein LapB [Thiotrichaceae bacterium]|nr:lipopolysaccharide assembly protein LapB [Thiotrichaceae bacterium]